MRICLVSFEYPPDSLIMGGAGTYASLLAKGLWKKGADVVTVTTGSKASRTGNVYKISINNMTYWRRFFFSEKAMKLIASLNQECRFDLIHLNEPHIITRNPGLPIVCTFHSTQLHEMKLNIEGGSLKTARSIRDLVVKNPMGHLCDIITGHMSSKIVCPSSDLVKLLKYCFIDERKIHIIPNGIDCEEIDEISSESKFLDRYDLEKDLFVLYMGRLHSSKGVHYLIQAFKRVKKKHEKLKLVITGKGDFEPYLRKTASGTKDILFLGYVDSLAIKKSLYKNCLTVVVPSIYETFPMVVLEAMACGKPVIASNVGGLRLLVAQGKSGLLVRPKDVTGIGTAIGSLLEDPNLSRKMGMFGRKLAEEQYTVEKMVEGTLEVYNSLL